MRTQKLDLIGKGFARLEFIFEDCGVISAISNTNSLSAVHSLQRTQSSLQDVFKRLASGRRINSGKDDPAGLIASERLKSEIVSLRAQTRSLERANVNANISEGHGAQLSSLYNDLTGLVVASANQAGMSDEEIAANQMQIDNTVDSIRRFHGDAVSSLDGFHMPDGGNADVQAELDRSLSAALSVRSGGANDLSSGNFEAAATSLKAATVDVAMARGRIGGYQKNVVGPQIRSNQVAIENLTESESRIADTDYAVEVSNLKRLGVLSAVGIRVLKIANDQPKSVLDLFA